MRALLLIVTLLVCGNSFAEAQRRANDRRGFWFGVGLGGGSAEFDCSSCSNDRFTGASGYIRLGGTLSRSILIGVESNGWLHSDDFLDESIGFGSVVVLWYPRRSGALYLKVGLGGITYRADDGIFIYTAKAPSASLGLGYEVRIGRNTSVVPYVNSLVGTSVQQYRDGDPIANGNDWSINLFQFGLGVTWH